MIQLKQYHRVILSGLAGVGKTEMAAQIVRKAKEARAYKGIFWLSAASETTLNAGMNGIARALILLEDSGVNIETVQARVLSELDVQDHWLMVLDNVDEVDLVRRFLPVQQGTRHVLITSRYGEAHSTLNGVAIYLDKLTEDEAGTLFYRTYFPKEFGGLNMLKGKYKDSVMSLMNQLG